MLNFKLKNYFVVHSCRVTALLHHAEDHSEFFIPWDQVILVCAEHMVAYLTSDLWVSGFYGNNTTEMFPLPSEWLKAQAETTFNSLAQVTSEGTPGSIRKYAIVCLSQKLNFTTRLHQFFVRPPIYIGWQICQVIPVIDKSSILLFVQAKTSSQ